MITEEQKEMLISSIDVTIQHITNNFSKLSDENKKEAREYLSKYLQLSKEVEDFKLKKQ